LICPLAISKRRAKGSNQWRLAITAWLPDTSHLKLAVIAVEGPLQ